MKDDMKDDDSRDGMAAKLLLSLKKSCNLGNLKVVGYGV
jgi:hypothetical protein